MTQNEQQLSSYKKRMLHVNNVIHNVNIGTNGMKCRRYEVDMEDEENYYIKIPKKMIDDVRENGRCTKILHAFYKENIEEITTVDIKIIKKNTRQPDDLKVYRMIIDDNTYSTFIWDEAKEEILFLKLFEKIDKKPNEVRWEKLRREENERKLLCYQHRLYDIKRHLCSETISIDNMILAPTFKVNNNYCVPLRKENGEIANYGFKEDEIPLAYYISEAYELYVKGLYAEELNYRCLVFRNDAGVLTTNNTLPESENLRKFMFEVLPSIPDVSKLPKIHSKEYKKWRNDFYSASTLKGKDINDSIHEYGRAKGIMKIIERSVPDKETEEKLLKILKER